jgi:hypothetical protein
VHKPGKIKVTEETKKAIAKPRKRKTGITAKAKARKEEALAEA